MALASKSPMDFPGQIEVHFGANFGPYTLSGDWWRLFTYMFLHGGLMHIFFNMWCLWDLGALCESLYGRWTFGAIYVITGIAAGLASIGWNPSVLSVGASGAIFGLAGALIASFYLGEFAFSGMAIKGTLRSLVLFAGFNLFFGGLFSGIDNAAHVGGLVSGLILGALIARVAPRPDSPRRIAVLALVALAVAGAALGVRQWRGTPMRMAREYEDISSQKGTSIAKFQAIVKQKPNMAAAHAALAQAYFQQQQFSEAEAEFKRAVELEPNNLSSRFNLGVVYLNEKRPDDAKTAFTQILAQDANNGGAHYGLGLVASDQGDYQEAVRQFKSAEGVAAEVSGVFFEMGNAYAKLKMYDEAIAAYAKEKDKNGDDPQLETALAEVYQLKGMTQQADEARNKASQLRSDHP